MGKKGKKVYCTDGREKKWHLGTISVKLYIKFEKKKKPGDHLFIIKELIYILLLFGKVDGKSSSWKFVICYQLLKKKLIKMLKNKQIHKQK